jgi:hypothetical protein
LKEIADFDGMDSVEVKAILLLPKSERKKVIEIEEKPLFFEKVAIQKLRGAVYQLCFLRRIG